MKKRFDTGSGTESMFSQLPVEQVLSLAIQRHQCGDLKQAQIIYRDILKTSPNQVDALLFLGIAMHQSGDTAGGVEFIRRSIALDPQPSRYCNFAKVLMEAGRFEEAIQAVNRALEIDAASADAHNALGQLFKAQQRFDEAALSFERAIMFNPQHAEAYNNMGNLLEMQGRAQESGPYYYKAITLMPPHMVAKKTLGAAYSALGEMEKAAAVYRQWLAEDPNNPEVRHLLAACTLENVPTRAEDAYVEYTFDAMAKNFDEHLGSLDYRAPQLMADAVQREYGAANKKLTILDAGCGTGLCGPLIATYAERLIGVDLSAGMLEKAKLRGVYDALVKAELTEYLHSQENAFDIIISSDTLNYFGVLNDVFKASRRALRQDGHLFFTVEVAGENAGSESESGYRINSHGRYSHNEDYLRRALNEAGFTIIALETATLRSESCNPVLGFIVTCRANGAAALT